MLPGCLKDNPLTADNFTTTDTINMLIYLESNGDRLIHQALPVPS